MNHPEVSRGRRGPSLLEVALEHDRRGWCIIPIRPGTKKPACRTWRQYQTARPNEEALRQWFGEGEPKSLAVIMGEVSGGLVCRDFDQMEGYLRWAAEYPDLAATLPTVATSRGRHVYCLGGEKKITKLADGELRGAPAGERAYETAGAAIQEPTGEERPHSGQVLECGERVGPVGEDMQIAGSIERRGDP